MPLRIYHYGYKKDKISFQINSKSVEIFGNLIPIECPHKKQYLEYKLKLKQRNKAHRTRCPEFIEGKIIGLLEIRPSKTTEIANHLLLTMGGILPHLNKLMEDGTIIKKGLKNEVVWDLD